MSRGRLSWVAAGCLLAAVAGLGTVRADGREISAEERALLRVFELLAMDLVPAERALATAQEGKAFPAVEIELEVGRSEGKSVIVWNVELLSGSTMHEHLIDARSGKLLRSDVEEENEAAQLAKAVAVSKVDLAAVIATIAKTVEGVCISIQLELDDGRAVWEAKVLSGGRVGEIEVDAATGRILPEEEDGDDDDDEDDD